MEQKSSKERILKQLRDISHVQWEYPEHLPDYRADVFPFPEPMAETFEIELTAIGGEVYRTTEIKEIIQKLNQLFNEQKWPGYNCPDEQLKQTLMDNGLKPEQDKNAIVSITGCEYLIARSGSVMVSSATGPGRKVHVSPRIHIVIAGISQLKPFIRDVMDSIKSKYNTFPSWIALITGPSRTADIEKTLVMGAHGPKKLIVFLNENN